MIVVAYFGWSQPFKINLLNRLEMFNELAILAHTYMLILFTDINDDGIFKAKLGWVIVGMTGIVFLVNMISIVCFILSTMIKKFIAKLCPRRVQKHGLFTNINDASNDQGLI